MKIFIILVFLNVLTSINSNDLQWRDFKSRFNISFESVTDENFRKKTYEENLVTIEIHNTKFDKGETTFRMGINQFSTMTFEEISFFNEINETIAKVTDEIIYDPIALELAEDDLDVPESFDWRNFGAVTSVKNQLKCGSCYAMATIGSIESQLFIKTRKLLELSVQEIVDCAGKYHTWGCDGGVKFRVFDYVRENGISSAKDYSYSGSQGECKSSHFKRSYFILKAFGEVSANDENILKLALIKVGPLAISINNSHESFFRYSSGIYYEPQCTNKISHAALLIGFGSENGKDFWIVKNSYGETWGEKGFIRMARNRDNHCGIASESLYPIIE